MTRALVASDKGVSKSTFFDAMNDRELLKMTEVYAPCTLKQVDTLLNNYA